MDLVRAAAIYSRPVSYSFSVSPSTSSTALASLAFGWVRNGRLWLGDAIVLLGRGSVSRGRRLIDGTVTVGNGVGKLDGTYVTQTGHNNSVQGPAPVARAGCASPFPFARASGFSTQAR